MKKNSNLSMMIGELSIPYTSIYNIRNSHWHKNFSLVSLDTKPLATYTFLLEESQLEILETFVKERLLTLTNE